MLNLSPSLTWPCSLPSLGSAASPPKNPLASHPPHHRTAPCNLTTTPHPSNPGSQAAEAESEALHRALQQGFELEHQLSDAQQQLHVFFLARTPAHTPHKPGSLMGTPPVAGGTPYRGTPYRLLRGGASTVTPGGVPRSVVKSSSGTPRQGGTVPAAAGSFTPTKCDSTIDSGRVDKGVGTPAGPGVAASPGVGDGALPKSPLQPVPEAAADAEALGWMALTDVPALQKQIEWMQKQASKGGEREGGRGTG